MDFTALAVGATLQVTATAYGPVPANQDLNPDGYAPTAPPINLRKMTYVGAFTDTLDYNLYTSNAYAAVWGDGTGISSTVAGVGAGLLAAATINITVSY